MKTQENQALGIDRYTLVELRIPLHVTLNQRVVGSSPTAPTKVFRGLASNDCRLASQFGNWEAHGKRREGNCTADVLTCSILCAAGRPHPAQIQLGHGTPARLARRHRGPEHLVQLEPAAVEVSWVMGGSQLGHGPPRVVEVLAEFAGEILLDLGGLRGLPLLTARSLSRVRTTGTARPSRSTCSCSPSASRRPARAPDRAWAR